MQNGKCPYISFMSEIQNTKIKNKNYSLTNSKIDISVEKSLTVRASGYSSFTQSTRIKMLNIFFYYFFEQSLVYLF